jgi:hypothetical protein
VVDTNNQEEIKDTYQFIDQLEQNMKLNFFKDIFNKSKLCLSKLLIENAELFKAGFKEAVAKEQKEKLKQRLQQFDSNFKLLANDEIKKYIQYYLGCDSICPGCGSKCDKEEGHEGSHKSKRHVFQSFHGWHHDGSRLVITKICWETFMHQVIVSDKKYDTFKQYLDECQRGWLLDIESNYNDFVASKADEGQIHRIEMIRTWMNTRKAFVAKYDIVDQVDYKKQWKLFEDPDKMLKENFKPEWKDQFEIIIPEKS